MHSFVRFLLLFPVLLLPSNCTIYFYQFTRCFLYVVYSIVVWVSNILFYLYWYAFEYPEFKVLLSFWCTWYQWWYKWLQGRMYQHYRHSLWLRSVSSGVYFCWRYRFLLVGNILRFHWFQITLCYLDYPRQYWLLIWLCTADGSDRDWKGDSQTVSVQ